MKLRLWLSAFILLVCSNTGLAQWDVYACLTNKKLVRVDYTDCSYKLLSEDRDYEDIALSPTGTLFGVSGDGLYKIDLKTGKGNILANCPIVNSLVFDKDGYLYGAHSILYQLDTVTGKGLPLGHLAATSAGDLTFFDEVMYMSGKGGDLVRISYERGVANSATSVIVGNMGISNMLGILTVFTETAGEIDYKMLGLAGNKAFEVNVLDASSTVICQGFIPGEFLGASSQAESWGGIQKRRKICINDSIQLMSYQPDIDIPMWKLPGYDSLGQPLTANGRGVWAKDTGQYYFYNDTIPVDTFHITYYPVPIADDQPNKILCHNEVYEYDTLGFHHLWIPDSSGSVVDTISPFIVTKPYKLIVTTEQGCVDSGKVTIAVRAPLQVKLAQLNDACEGKLVKLSATSAGGNPEHYKIDWNIGNNFTDYAIIEAHEPFWIKVELSDGCMPPVSDSIFLNILPTPVASFEAQYDSLTDESWARFINRSTGADEFYWLLDDSLISQELNSGHIFKENGAHRIGLIAVNNAGCADTTYKDIIIKLRSTLYLPTAFTPNNDGENDIYKIKGYGISEIEWQVHNRWGELVFISNSVEEGWDGKYKGLDAPDGVYLVTVKAMGNHEHINETAELLLIR